MITIDVAYRYFSTARRKLIGQDTVAIEQYTRNIHWKHRFDQGDHPDDARNGVVTDETAQLYYVLTGTGVPGW